MGITASIAARSAGCPMSLGLIHAFPAGDGGKFREEIPVVDADQLVHARAGPDIAGNERLAGERVGDVTQNGLGLVKLEAIVLDRRHPPERLPRKLRFRPHVAWLPGDDCVRGAPFLKREKDASEEGASRNAIDGDFAHLILPAG